MSAESIAALIGDENVTKFGAGYGSYCAAWEDGKCDGAPTDNVTAGHGCGSVKTCHELWPTYDFQTNQAWCCDSWCYIDRTTCTTEKAAEHGITLEPSWLGVDLQFSYNACPDPYSSPSKYEFEEGTNYASFNHSQCPYVVTAPGCECMGSNSGLGADEIAFHGKNYGKWCAAWEDGKCDENATKGPGHTCFGVNQTLLRIMEEEEKEGNHSDHDHDHDEVEGLHIESCPDHWPTYNFMASQTWCCDAWCYVNPRTCTAEIRQQYGIDMEQSWTGAEAFYSYGACADPITSTMGHKKNGGVANFAQFEGAGQGKCPYTISSTGPLTRPFIAVSLLIALFSTQL